MESEYGSAKRSIQKGVKVWRRRRADARRTGESIRKCAGAQKRRGTEVQSSGGREEKMRRCTKAQRRRGESVKVRGHEATSVRKLEDVKARWHAGTST